MFAVDFDAGARRLTLRLSGFWCDETMTAFENALKRSLAEAERTTPTFDTLSDASAFPVQSPAISLRFGTLMASLASNRHGKVAIIVASTLNKMQAERAIASPATRIFLDRATAIRWFAEGD